MHALRKAFAAHLEDGQTIEPQEGQIGQVFFAQGFSTQVGVDVSNPGESAGRGSKSFLGREQNLSRVANDHLLNVAPAVDEDADLPADFPGDLG